MVTLTRSVKANEFNDMPKNISYTMETDQAGNIKIETDDPAAIAYFNSKGII